MIKHDMIRKYRTDDVQNNRNQKGSKNQMVVSREHNRLDDNEKRGGKDIEKRLRKWMKGKSLEGMDDTDEAAKNVDPIDFFLPHMIEHRPFIRLAIFLLSCPVQSAPCERLFKDFAFFDTKTRNRLSDPIRKRLNMIRHDMIRKYGADDVQNKRKKRKQEPNGGIKGIQPA